MGKQVRLFLLAFVLALVVPSLLALNVVPLREGIATITREQARQTPADDLNDFFDENVSPDNIRNNLRFLTTKPHLAGTQAEVETAQWVADTWTQQGLDDVNMASYQVLLSYPDPDAPNMVRLLDKDTGAILAQSTPRQPPLFAPEESRDDIPYSFNAYSAPADVQGEIVYGNYGRSQDFDFLDKSGVNLSEKILLARYGMVFRANIVSAAEGRGAVGVILYTDPEDYALLGPDSVYPGTVMMPPSGTQQGTAKLVDGDPLTPFYPAIESAFHIPEEEAAIPKIPVQPVSYEDAYFLLNSLGGPAAPQDWQGSLNLTYNLGPTRDSFRVQLEVHTHNQPTTVHNVIGVLRGSEEPDRYVLIGNHRDAWVFGAVDPSSGTAVMMEMSRVLMQLHNETGWRPRRSLVLCSWAAEEYGLVGSMEWTEQYAKQLQDRAVAYLNMDLALVGNYSLKVTTVPLLYDVIWDASKLVSNPDPAEVAAGRTSVYDTWKRNDPGLGPKPNMLLLGSGSDYKGFLHNLGIPASDICYNHDRSIPGWYPLYHSLYDTFELVDELYDRGFLYHGALTKVWANMVVRISDSVILPFSLDQYAMFITNNQEQIQTDFGDLLSANNRSFGYFKEACDKFAKAVTTFEDNLVNLDLNSPLAVRRVNDQIMMLERSFIDSRGLPDRPDYNHVVFAPSTSDSYSGTAFSGLTDTLTAVASASDPEHLLRLWRVLDEHLAVVTHLVSTASAVLTDDLWATL